MLLTLYQLYATENGKHYMLIAVDKHSPDNLLKDNYDLMLRQIRGDWAEEPPWEKLGWEVEAMDFDESSMNRRVLSSGSLKNVGSL